MVNHMSDDCELTIRDFVRMRMLGYQFPHVHDGCDSNWLNVHMLVRDGHSVRDRHSQVSFTGAYVHTLELVLVRQEVACVLVGDSPECCWAPMEAWWDPFIRRNDETDGIARFSLTVELELSVSRDPEQFSEHKFHYTIDLADVKTLFDQLDHAVRCYPLRGEGDGKQRLDVEAAGRIAHVLLDVGGYDDADREAMTCGTRV